MKKAVGILKIAAIAALLVSLVCLSLIYMSFYRNEESVEFTPKMDAAVRDKVYRAGYVGLMSGSLVRPYFLGYSFGGTRTGYFGTGSEELFGEMSEALSEILGPDSRLVKTDRAAFASCFDGDFVYIRFRFELPRSVIYYMLNTDMILEEVGDEYIYDVVIPVNQARDAVAVMRDLRGNCYICYPDAQLGININTFAPYNDREDGFAFSFVYESRDDTSLLTVGGKSADKYEILAPSEMTARSAVVEAGDLSSNGAKEKILTVLGLDPEKVTSHDDDDGTTYYGESENIRIGKDGTLSYSVISAQHGIGISDVVGYEFSDNNYTVSDCVGAALLLADSLGVFDGDAFSYAVTCAEKDGSDITVGISYVYDGFTVVNDGVYALKMTVSEGKITSLYCCYAKAHVYDGEYAVENAKWCARLAVIDGGDPVVIEYVQTIKNSRLYLSIASLSGEEGEK